MTPYLNLHGIILTWSSLSTKIGLVDQLTGIRILGQSQPPVDIILLVSQKASSFTIPPHCGVYHHHFISLLIWWETVISRYYVYIQDSPLRQLLWLLTLRAAGTSPAELVPLMMMPPRLTLSGRMRRVRKTLSITVTQKRPDHCIHVLIVDCC